MGACVLAGFVAWLPNSVLPNHYFPGYSWSGAYVLFLPLLYVAALNIDGRLRYRLLLGGAALLALASPLLYRSAYKQNEWVLMQEQTQRNMLPILERMTASLPPGVPSRVLVTGKTFPFSPFDYPAVLRRMAPAAKPEFDVVSYDIAHGPGKDGVRYLSPWEIHLLDYDEVWMFRDDGLLVARLPKGFIPSEITASPDYLPTLSDYVLYPQLIYVVQPEALASPSLISSGQFLILGIKYLLYANYRKAEVVLRHAVELNSSDPACYFFLGGAVENQGRKEEALEYYRKAVDLDVGPNKNNVFLSQYQKLISEFSR